MNTIGCDHIHTDYQVVDGKVMGREFEAPQVSNDASSIKEAPVNPERSIVQFPTTEKDRADWQKNISGMRDSTAESASGILPGLELTGDSGLFGNKELSATTQKDVDGDGILDNLTGPSSTELKRFAMNSVGAEKLPDAGKLSNADKLPNEDNLTNAINALDVSDPNAANNILDQLARLQKQQLDLQNSDKGSNSDQDSFVLGIDSNSKDNQNDGYVHAGADDASFDVGTVAQVANPHSYEFHASSDQVGQERKGKFAQIETGGNGGAEQQLIAEAQALAVSALAGDVSALVTLATSGLPPQGVEQVSIYDLKMRKENDGQVVLLAPREGDGAYSDGIPLVRNDGKPVSAMELGQYLRPDGTILMGDQGRAYRPGDEIVVASSNTNKNEITDSTFAGRSLVLEQNELKSATSNMLSGVLETKEKYAALRDSRMEARSLDSVVSSGDTDAASDSNDSVTAQKAALSFEPKQAAEEQRTIRTRLGETLRSIALRDLNDVKSWQALAEKNNLPTDTDGRGNPLAVLQRGMTLTLPSAAEIENFQARASLAASLQLS